MVSSDFASREAAARLWTSRFLDDLWLVLVRSFAETHMPSASEIIDALGLRPHPIEGGFFRETYRSSAMIPASALPAGYREGSDRSIGTAIYYLLTADTFSEMHRLPTEEVFHLYLGGPIHMLQLFPNGGGREITIGAKVLAGEHPQVVVPPHVWQGSRLAPGVEFALLGATVAPGFDYADYEQGRRTELTARYPGHAEAIRLLTRSE
jgi:predicted cupin superfamily sugar epimerase